MKLQPLEDFFGGFFNTYNKKEFIMKKMPGYDDHMAKVNAEEEKKRREQEKVAATAKAAAEKVTEEEKKRQFELAATKFESEKKDIIKKELMDNKESKLSYGKGQVVKDFMKMFAISMGIAFVGGNFLWAIESAEHAEAGKSFPSYSESIKAVYLWKDVSLHNRDLFNQALAGFIAFCASVFMAGKVASGNKSERKKELDLMIDEYYKYAEGFKKDGVRPMNLEHISNQVGNIILSKMSAKDMGYIDNLLRGGLDKASYENVVAIIKGHLESHPEDYEKIIQVIDESTMPEEITKKYGKTISFGAARAIADIEQGR